MVFSLEDLKMEIANILRDGLAVKNTSGDISIDLNKDTLTEVAQSFYSFSTAYREGNWNSFPVDIMVKKVGSPKGSLAIALMSSSDDLPSGTIISATLPPSSIPSTYSERTKYWINLSKLNTPNIGSYTKYFFKIFQTGTVDSDNYYSIARDSLDSGYLFGSAYQRLDSGSWSALSSDINFEASFPTWIYPDYPDDKLELFKYPRVAVDISDRTAKQPYISHLLSDYDLKIMITIYSRQPSELDALVSNIDRILFKERTSISSFSALNPSNFSNVAIARPGILARSIFNIGQYRMIADS